MATLMKNIRGTNNAFEYSESVTATSTNVQGAEIFVPSNVATVTLGLRRQSGTGGYKMQATYSTRNEVDLGTAEWFDWDISGLDASGFLDQDEFQFWMPIPSHLRLVVEGDGSTTEVYMAMRAN